MADGKTIYAALLAIQQGISVPKSEEGYGYKYRTADGIMQAVKPLLQEQGVICFLADKAEQVGNRYYVTTTATLVDIATGDSISTTGTAVEPDRLANMAPPQITGTASSYARKRALEGLFLLDNEKDVDSKEVQNAIRGNQNSRPNPNVKAQDDMRRKAMHSLNEAVKKTGVSKQELIALCGVHFGKASTSEMTTGQISIMAAHLEEWVAEAMGGK